MMLSCLGFFVDDVWVDLSAYKTLSFVTPNPGLEDFNKNDVVQTSSTWIRGNFNNPPIFADGQAAEYSGFPHTNAFDGNTNSQALPAAGGNRWTWNFPSIAITEQLRVYYSGNLSYMVINGRTLQSYSPTLNSNWAIIPASSFAGDGGTLNQIYIEYFSGGIYCYLQAVEIDGKLLVDDSIADPTAIKVASDPDVNNNTMLVTGGTWGNGVLTGTVTSSVRQFSVWNGIAEGETLINGSNYPLRTSDSDVYYTRWGGVAFSSPILIPAGSRVSIDACNEDFFRWLHLLVFQ